MKKNNKIKAFTLSEMMVAIVITLLVVGMAFSVLGLIKNHMNSISYNLDQSSQLDRLEQVLWIDFNRYESVRFNNGRLTFKNEMDSLYYELNEKKIIRNIDTFNIQVKEVETLWEGKKVNFGFINAIKLITDKESQNKTVFIYKNNDAAAYMD